MSSQRECRYLREMYVGEGVPTAVSIAPTPSGPWYPVNDVDEESRLRSMLGKVISRSGYECISEINRTAPQVTHHCPECERLRAELLACCELHERSMMIIEEALGPDRPNGGTWRAQQIANEIIALRNFIAMDKEATTGERIRQMRLARGMTQDQLSSAAGISKGFLSDVENGKRDISSRNLLRIATALSASVDYLLQGVFCPACEAAARQLADIAAVLRTGSSGDTLLGKEVSRWIDTAHAAEQERVDLRAHPIVCACGDHIGYAEDIGLSQEGAICGNCAVGRTDYDARTDLATLRARLEVAMDRTCPNCGSTFVAGLLMNNFPYCDACTPLPPCPGCEAAARERDKYVAAYCKKEVARYDAEQEANQAQRERDDLRARLDKLADRWDTESVAEYKQCASELEALLAETEAK